MSRSLPPVVGLADVARVLTELRPDAEQLAMLNDLLFGDRPAVRRATPTSGYQPKSQRTPDLSAPDADPEQVRSTVAAPTEDIAVPCVLNELPDARELRPPRPGRSLEQLLLAEPEPPPFSSLFPSASEQALLRVLCSTLELRGELDEDAAVDALARGRTLPEFPRRPIPTTARGLQLLIDTSADMQPYEADLDRLITRLLSVVPDDLLDVRWFVGHPWGPDGVIGSDDLSRPYRLPPVGTPVIAITLFGRHNRAVPDDLSLAHGWRRLTRAARRAGNPVIFLCPTSDPAPAATRAFSAPALPWTPAASVRAAQRVVRRASRWSKRPSA